MPLDLIGGTFKRLAEILPFFHSVEAIKKILAGDFSTSLHHLLLVLAYTALVFMLAIIAFKRKMTGGKA